MNSAELNEIRRLINEEFKSDSEIIRSRKIPARTYYRYKKKILREDADILKKTREENLEHDLMQVRRTLEFITEKCIDIINDPENYDTIEALELLGRCAYAKVDSLYSPTMTRKNVQIISKDVKQLASR